MRVLAAIIGIALLAGVVWLGILSGQNNAFLVWFGLASAIAAPMGIAALTYSIRGRSQRILEELSKVPEVQKLIEEARTREEQIKILQTERQKLQDIITSEARRQALLSRRGAAEDQARALTREIDVLDTELERYSVMPEEASISKEAVEELRKRIKSKLEGDLVFQVGGRTIVLEKSLFLGLPLGGLIFQYFRMADYLLESMHRSRRSARAIEVEPGAAPNGGPPTQPANSGVTEGSHR